MGDRFLLVTQNVDGLHQRAGSRRLVEMHGSLFGPAAPAVRPRGVRGRARVPRRAVAAARCARAGRGGRLRPAVVWFGEMLDPMRLAPISAFIEDARRGRLVFLAVGTSALVYPAAGLVLEARGAGGRDVARQRRAARRTAARSTTSCRARAARSCRSSSSGPR